MEHSIFSTSAVDSWKFSACPAYVLHNQESSESNIHMATGTVFHSILEDYFKNGDEIPKHFGQIYEADGFEIEVDQKMIDCAEFNIAAVEEIKAKYPGSDLIIEQKVSLDDYGYPEVFGTPDIQLFEVFGNLIVIDHKYGRGKTVYADAGQLKLYLIMAAGKMIHTFENLISIVLQPRDVHGEKLKLAYHNSDALLEWLENEVIAAVENVKSGDPIYRPSDESCRWCNYRGKCRAQSDLALQLINQDLEGVPDLVTPVIDPRESKSLSPLEMSNILKHEKFLIKWIESVRWAAETSLTQGIEIPEFKLAETVTHRKWDPNKDVEHILYKECKIRKKDMFTQKIKSPTAVLDLIGDKNPAVKKRVEELIIRPQGRPKLVHESDRREKIDMSIDKDLEGIEDFKE